MASKSTKRRRKRLLKGKKTKTEMTQSHIDIVENYALQLRNNIPKSEQWFLELFENSRQSIELLNNVRIESRIADFVCEKFKVVIEVDGKSHDTAKQKEIDKKKDDMYQRKGYHVIRIKAYDINSFNEGMTSFRHVITAYYNKIEERKKRRQERGKPIKSPHKCATCRKQISNFNKYIYKGKPVIQCNKCYQGTQELISRGLISA